MAQIITLKMFSKILIILSNVVSDFTNIFADYRFVDHFDDYKLADCIPADRNFDGHSLTGYY